MRNSVVNRMILTAAVCASGWGVSLRAEEPSGPLSEPGVRKQVQRLCRLTWEEGGIRLDRKGWARMSGEAESEAMAMSGARRLADPGSRTAGILFENVAGQSAGGVTPNRGGALLFSAKDLKGYLHLCGRDVRITLREKTGPERTVEIQDDEEGAFRLFVSSPLGGAMVVLEEGRDGRFNLAWFDGKRGFPASGPAFQDYYRAHADFVEQELFPRLESLGIRPPPVLYSQEVVRIVCARLSSHAPEARERVHGLFSRLSDDDPIRRGEAERELVSNFERYRDWVEDRLAAPSIPQDEAELLRGIARAHAEEHQEAEAAACLVSRGKLTRDPAYLIGLLRRMPEADRGAVALQLEQLTGEHSGVDAGAWERWLEKKGRESR